jgi:hypothetical protein
MSILYRWFKFANLLFFSDYAKVCIAVTALTELGTLVRDEEGNLTLPQENVKVNLSNAPVLKRISEHKG